MTKSKKMILILSLFVVNVSAHAYTYECFSFDENSPYGIQKFTLKTIKSNKVKITFDAFKNEESYDVVLDTLSRSPANVQPQMDLNLSTLANSYPESPVGPFTGDAALLKGGYPLRNSKYGGFMKTTGAGYRRAKYVCYLKK